MNSGFGQRLSVEELKRLNQPPVPSVSATPPDTPTGQNWDDLLAALMALYQLEITNSDRLERLEASVAAQEALLRALGRQVGQLPTQAQLEALHAMEMPSVERFLQEFLPAYELTLDELNPPRL